MELTTEKLANGVTKVNLSGRLDIIGAQQIDLQFSVVSGSQLKVIVDLEQVSFLASMGIRTILIGAKAVKAKGGRMVLLKPTPDVEKVLTTTAIDTLISIVHDLDAAIGVVSD
jgi:anti-sigma B factor antagonist